MLKVGGSLSSETCVSITWHLGASGSATSARESVASSPCPAAAFLGEEEMMITSPGNVPAPARPCAGAHAPVGDTARYARGTW